MKCHRNYSIAEAAEVLGVHTNTIANWMKAGLPTIRPRNETLIIGRHLKSFLEARDRKRKAPCPPGTMYCFKCRQPRRPPPGLIEPLPATGAAINLRGLCPECGGLMHRKVALGGLIEAGFPSALGAGADT